MVKAAAANEVMATAAEATKMKWTPASVGRIKITTKTTEQL